MGTTDQTLLQRYVSEKDERAFTELVHRHGGMVHASARRLFRDDADDIAQAVFVLLARKASSLSHHQNLAGWLYQTTRLCAANARKIHQRRERQIQVVREAAVNNTTTSTQPDLTDLIDAGLAELPESHRRVILLRHLEGLSLEATADRLQTTTGAVAKRAERGIEKLRSFFSRNGQNISAATVGTCLGGQVSALPESMMSTIVRAANGVASETASLLVQSVMWAQTAMKIKIAAAILVAVTAGTGAAIIVPRMLAQSPVTAPNKVIPASAPAPAPAVIAQVAPQPLPAGVTQDAASAVATEFFDALGTSNPDRVAAILANGSDAERRALAAKYIAEFRNGRYARYPQRLSIGSGSSFVQNRTGNSPQPCSMPSRRSTRRWAI